MEDKCLSRESYVALKENPQYKRFLIKWNLPVYFQIRFQEIAGAIETVLTVPISPACIKGTLETFAQKHFSLHATYIIAINIQRIWSKDVYLNQLFHR